MATNWLLASRKHALQQRSLIIQQLRNFFINEGYLEVDTPLRIPAPAPEVHIDAIAAGQWFLHTSPELCMKRMVAAGFDRIFQLCHCWRDGERGRLHLPEFSMLEWYCANADYFQIMDDCQSLIRYVSKAMGNGDTLSYQGKEISLTGDWERLTVQEAFSRFTGMSMEEALAKDFFDELMARDIEPQLGLPRPTFIYDYPIERAALARISKDNPSVAERFELYIGGIEIANAFSELTDPEEQRKRFIVEAEQRQTENRAPYPLPEKFLEELSDLTNTAGIALGVDRLVMLLLDESSIDRVVPFTPEEL